MGSGDSFALTLVTLLASRCNGLLLQRLFSARCKEKGSYLATHPFSLTSSQGFTWSLGQTVYAHTHPAGTLVNISVIETSNYCW